MKISLVFCLKHCCISNYKTKEVPYGFLSPSCQQENRSHLHVYEAVSIWNKELKQARNKQVCVGKIDPAIGAFVYSKRLDLKQAGLRDPAVTILPPQCC